jgi:large subunit ribosomal protein L15
MALKNRKIRKKRGSRTVGRGSHKKARGSGNRGGTGMAGTHKGKWTWVIKYAPDYFGRRGFDVPEEVKDVYETINVGELDEIAEELVAKGIAREVDGKIEVDVTQLGVEKVLGTGKVTHALVVRARRFSSRAIEKITEAGGEAIVLE